MEQNPTPNSETNNTPQSHNTPDNTLPTGIHLGISLTDTEGKVIRNETFVPSLLLDNIDIEPPVIIMDALRQLSAELIAHVFPDEINQLPTPARPEHPNENGKLN